jgi:hypothetical protein
LAQGAVNFLFQLTEAKILCIFKQNSSGAESNFAEMSSGLAYLPGIGPGIRIKDAGLRGRIVRY